jgi:hypothetical protein
VQARAFVVEGIGADELSRAYPFFGLGFTAVLGNLIFHDTVALPRLLRTLLVIVGIYFIARGWGYGLSPEL